MSTILLLGFLMGVRHSLEADHLAAVASLATRSRSVGSGVRQGVVWGLGHSLTLLLVGGLCLAVQAAVPVRLARGLETVVGFMLLALGADVLWRMHRRRVHVHVHHHEGGATHLHAHRHDTEESHDPARHDHPHAAGFPARAFFVGVTHGMAGSAALLLLALQGVQSFASGLACIALFGLGSILGMATLSLVITVPLRLSARLFAPVYRGLEAVVGFATVAIGVRVLWNLRW